MNDCEDIRRGDAVGDMLRLLTRRQGDQGMGDPRRPSFQKDEQARRQRTEISEKYVSVGRVDDDWDATDPGRPTSEDARLRRVGMDNPGTLAAYDCDQSEEGGQIGNRMEVADQVGEGDQADTALNGVGTVLPGGNGF